MPEKKTIAVASAILIIAAILIAGGIMAALSFIQPGMINANFENASLRPGEMTILVVDVRNTLDKDATAAIVSVDAVDNSSIEVPSEAKTATSLARGDWRRLNFPVRVRPNASEGSYSVDINVSIDGKNGTIRSAIEVKKRFS